MQVKKIDLIVLTVKSLEKSIKFYTDVLNMTKETFEKDRVSLKFGNHKINLHLLKTETFPKAQNPTMGSSDICFIVTTNLQKVYQKLLSKNVTVVEGIVKRTGAS